MIIEVEVINATQQLPDDLSEVLAYLDNGETVSAYQDGDLWIETGGGVIRSARVIAWSHYPHLNIIDVFRLPSRN